MIIEFEGKKPKVHEQAYIVESAQIIGDVEIGAQSSVWFNAVVRGDIHFIRIGERTSIQDLCVIHVTKDKYPTIVGNDVTLGHGVILHGCTIKDMCLIGIGSVVLDDAVIGPECLVAAGSLITPGFKAEPGTLIMGRPAKTIRKLNDKELELIRNVKDKYISYIARYKEDAKKKQN